MSIAVAVVGAGGRMGQAVCMAVETAPDLDLVARIDPAAGLDDLSAIGSSGASVAVDFTHPSAIAGNVESVLRSGAHAVVGTSGWTQADADGFSALCDETGRHCALVPNFAIGAVLLMRMATLCAPWFDRAEIIELHHDGKADAPSGTARATAELMNGAKELSGGWPDRGESEELIHGSRGGLVGGVRVHSVRLPGLVAHQEVLLGTEGQTLSLRHDSTDRASFMAGVLLAVRRIDDLPGLTIGLDRMLSL